MKFAISNQVVLSRAPEGPLARYIGSFADSLDAHGIRAWFDSPPSSALLRASANGSSRKAVSAQDMTLRSSDAVLAISRSTVAGLVRAIAAALTTLGRLSAPRGRDFPQERLSASPEPASMHCCIDAYEEYCARSVRWPRDDRQLRSVHSRSFLEASLRRRTSQLSSCLSAADVVSFVQRQAPRLHWKRAKLMTTALRSFLSYARYLRRSRRWIWPPPFPSCPTGQ